jgi:hypothetical protein
MAHFDKQFHVNKLNIALHQLERAILLLLNENYFSSSLTLAGAAEDIFSGICKNKNKKPCVEAQAKRLKDQGLSELSEKEIKFLHLNLTRNALKHFHDEADENMSLALETEAIALIVRGLDNVVKLEIKSSKSMNDFVLWMKKNRPDITNSENGVEIDRH